MDKERSKSEKLPFDLDEESWLQIAKMAEMGLSAGAVAHEARQPLSALKMTLQLMRDGSDDPASAKEKLDNALVQTERLERLLAQLRSFLLPNAQGRVEADISELVDGVLSLLRGGAKNKKVEITSEFEPGLPRVVIEKHTIEQVVYNLIANAKDAVLESGGGRIVVLGYMDSPESVKLVIADDGPGIDPSIADRIFKPYFTTKGKDKGTGLGLYIAKRITEQHGAGLELLDENGRASLGRGRLSTAFRISFLLPAQRLTIPPPVMPAKQGNNALVVSNVHEETQLIENVAKAEGFKCTSVASGDEALSIIGDELFDFLFVSMDLDGITGIEIARLLRNLNPLMPIILVTDRSEGEIAGELRGLRRAASEKRPLDPARLSKTVRSLTSSPDRKGKSPPVRTQAPKTAPAGDLDKTEARRATARNPRVVVVESEDEIREKIELVLRRVGCEVKAIASEEEAEALIERDEFDVFVANIAVLKNRMDRLAESSGKGQAPASLAIMDGGGIDKTMEAIRLGANGVFFPPFEEDRVALELKRAVGWRTDE